MRFLRKRRERARARKEQKQFEQEMADRFDPSNLQTELPVAYDDWKDFWQHSGKGRDEYVVTPKCAKVGGFNVLITDDMNKPIALTYLSQYIRDKAIDEAVEREQFEIAQRIKNE